MKNFNVLLLLLGFAISAQALSFKITGKNQELLFNEELSPNLPSSLGQVSLDLFNQRQIPYQGGVFGFSKIFEIGQHIEVISNQEMKAYGWCFSVDGVAPDTMADETLLENPDSQIHWFYGYAHFKDGEWIAQCQSF